MSHPGTSFAGRMFAVVMVVTVILAFGIGAYYTFAGTAGRQAAINDARVAALFCQKMTADKAQETVEKLHAQGASWPDAARAFRVQIGCVFGK